MENFTICLKWTNATVILVVLIVNLRYIIEAWIVKRGEIQLEAERLRLKAELINERESRWQLAQAEKLIRQGGEL
jgi:hypothetical protein